MLVSQLLSKVRIRASQFGLVQCTEPWGGRMPATDQPVLFAILEGACLLEVAGEDEQWLNVGDVALLPRGAAFRLSSASDAPDMLVTEMLRQRGVQSYTLRQGGGGRRCAFLAALSSWDDVAQSTIARFLPELLVVSRAEFSPDSEAEATVSMLVREAERARAITPIIANDLLSILLHELLYARLGNPELRQSLLSSFGSPTVVRALMLVHSTLVPDWTVSALAQRVGMSRSAFTVKFTQVTGRSPGQYLTEQRLETAARLLRESGLDVGAVADRVGYASMPSFIKAFKRRYGCPPGKYRGRTSAAENTEHRARA